jgi:hypothetical protein
MPKRGRRKRRARYWRARRFCGEANLAARSGQTQRHGPSAVAVMHPIDAVGTIAPLEPLHLPFTQLQQTSSFAYAQPPAYCILNRFQALELFPVLTVTIPLG